MKRLTGIVFILVAVLLVAHPLWASIADDVKAKKPVVEMLENAIIAGLSWEETIYQAVVAGGDPMEVITTALTMGADPQQVVKGARRAKVSEKVIRDAFAAAKESFGVYASKAPDRPLTPLAPPYQMGSGGGVGRAASPYR